MAAGVRLELAGKRVGKLQVIERAPRPATTRSGGAFWRCRCDCGNEIVREARNLDLALRRGSLSSCGCALSEAKSAGGRTRGIDITGQVFGSLTALRRVPKPRGATQRSIYYACGCACGEETIAHAGELRAGSRHHCGCRTTSRTRLAGDEAARRDLLRIYRSSAAHRNLVFDLTEDEFFRLTSEACCYCGSPPLKKQIRKRRASEPSVYRYNGLDRQDNEQGYTPENCVACCEQCNKAKRRMSPDEFRRWIARVYEHYVEGGE